MAACVLSGCNQAEDAAVSGQKNPGRYAGIGTYDAGRLWAEMAGVEAPSDPAAARLADDEHVIVVIDSHTGEVRQCGDYSGVCVAMNPWTGQGARTVAPVKLGKHAADLAAEDEAAVEEPATATDEAAPGR
jgi:hypothetical protein